LQNSRERVKAAISHQLPDRIPRGELCIEDDLVGQCLNCSEVGFEERAAFIEELGLDLVTLAPDYPVSSTVPEIRQSSVLFPDSSLHPFFIYNSRLLEKYQPSTKPMSLIKNINFHRSERVAGWSLVVGRWSLVVSR
jgi:hypothetical protein